MKRLWMSGAAAVMAISVSTLGAQTPQQPPTQPPTQSPTTQAPAPASAMAAQEGATTTIQGCVYKEQAVPGRAPNVAEKAGILEDYILVASADASATAGTSGATAGTSGMTPPATAGTAGTMSAASATKAYKLEKISDELLRAAVGKRVEVTGRVDASRGDMAAGSTAAGTAGAPAADRSLGPDKINLPEFEVTSMREVAGTCPATPMMRK